MRRATMKMCSARATPLLMAKTRAMRSSKVTLVKYAVGQYMIELAYSHCRYVSASILHKLMV